MAHRRKLIVGNWKMHGRLTSGVTLATDLVNRIAQNRPASHDLVVCPPSTLLWPIGEVLSGSHILLGAQDCHPENHGAYTGNVSAAMLVDIGCRYVILGHSERRTQNAESNALIARKVSAAQQAGLLAIVCVGETKEEYESGRRFETVEAQLRASLPNGYQASQLVVAYEPVWAIGTGLTAEVPEIESMHKVLRRALGPVGEAVQILYGGSVTPQTAEGIMSCPEVDGVLVGSASLSADSFWAISEKA